MIPASFFVAYHTLIAFFLHSHLGTHLSPVEFHQAMLDPNTVVIDVRNFNETVIGKFAPAAVALEAGETNGEWYSIVLICCQRAFLHCWLQTNDAQLLFCVTPVCANSFIICVFCWAKSVWTTVLCMLVFLLFSFSISSGCHGAGSVHAAQYGVPPVDQGPQRRTQRQKGEKSAVRIMLLGAFFV